MNGKINRRPIADKVYEAIEDEETRGELEQAFKTVDRYRYEGDISDWDEEIGRLIVFHARLQDEFPRVVTGAALGDLKSITGRWLGKTDMLLEGVGLVREYRDFLERDTERFGRVALAQARAWLGNALTRLGYLTGEYETLREAVTLLRMAHRDLESGWELAAAMRDLGDAHVGVLAFVDKAEITGCAIAELDLAVNQFEFLLEDSEVSDFCAHELHAAKSSRAVAASLMLELMSNPDQPVTPRYHFADAKDSLAEGALKDIESVFDFYDVGNSRDFLFRNGRPIGNLAFATHWMWRYSNDREMADISEEAFSKAIRCYVPDQHRFRSAVMHEGLGDLYRDRSLRELYARGRARFLDSAMSEYNSALALFKMTGVDTRYRMCQDRLDFCRN